MNELLPDDEDDFYYSLSLLANYARVDKNEQKKYLEAIYIYQDNLSILAANTPINYLHRYQLIGAEIARVLENKWEAVELYEQAIKNVRKNQYIQDIPLVYKLAAEFYLAQGMEQFAQIYLQQAYDEYVNGKDWINVKELELRYPQFLPKIKNDISVNHQNLVINCQTEIGGENSKIYQQLEAELPRKYSQVKEKNHDLEQKLRDLQLLEEKLHTSETTMRAILEAMTDIILVISRQGSIQVVPTNTGLLYDENFDIIGQTIEQFFQDQTTDIWWEQIHKALEQQQTIEFDYSLSSSEQEIWFATRISPMTNNSVVWVARDLSDRKQAEAALCLSEEKFKKAFRSSPNAMTITRLADGTHIEVNETFCRQTGYSREEIIGYTANDLNLWINQEDRIYLFNLLQSNRLANNYEFKFKTKSGLIRTTLLSAEIINIRGEDCLLSLSNDITERKQAEEALRQKNEELAQTLLELKVTQEELIQSEKMAALGELIAGIAHEINTPLGAIRASIGNIVSALSNSLQQLPQLLPQLSLGQQQDFFTLLAVVQANKATLSFREERQLKRTLIKNLESAQIHNGEAIATALVNMGFTQNITDYISLLQADQNLAIIEAISNLAMQQRNSQNIILAVERAAKIVFALKSYARYDHSDQKIKTQVIEGIEVVLTIYHHQLKQGIEVTKDYQEVVPILGYPEELNQVWTNLIHNAIQAMNYQGNLRIRVQQQDPYVVVEITDSGCGIPMEIKSKIFEPFFTTKSAGEGTGLGLDIVRKIIEKHSGKIEVDSEPGRTTFRVWLSIAG